MWIYSQFKTLQTSTPGIIHRFFVKGRHATNAMANAYRPAAADSACSRDMS